jgi:thioredoxin reductase (NADPH)
MPAIAETTDVGLVGAGPVGLELAVALKREGIDYLHFEAGQVGQTISWWAPATRWFSSNERISIAGIPLVTDDQAKATREQYLAYLRQIVGAFDLRIRTFEPAADIQRLDDAFLLTTHPRGGPRTTRCRRLILATGGTDFPRTLGIEGEDLPHVDGYLREPHRYFGRKVLILGGRNSAVEAALRCFHAGADVTLSYRRDQLPETSIKYWLLPEIRSLMKAGRIKAHFGTIATKITPTHVTLARCDSQCATASPAGEAVPDERSSTASPLGEAVAPEAGEAAFGAASRGLEIEADDVLKLVGYEQDKRLLKRAGIQLVGEEQKPAFDEHTMETNIPGLYVAGTAVGGTQQKFRIFLENCHVHVPRILNHLLNRPALDEHAVADNIALQPES